MAKRHHKVLVAGGCSSGKAASTCPCLTAAIPAVASEEGRIAGSPSFLVATDNQKRGGAGYSSFPHWLPWRVLISTRGY